MRKHRLEALICAICFIVLLISCDSEIENNKSTGGSSASDPAQDSISGFNIYNGEETTNSDDGVGALVRAGVWTPSVKDHDFDKLSRQQKFVVESSCTASEIKNRCLLTAAHCQKDKSDRIPENYYYRQHWYARYYDPLSDRWDLIKEGGFNKPMRMLRHRHDDSVDWKHRVPYAANDLMLFYQKPWQCKATEVAADSVNCDIKDSNAMPMHWNPLSQDHSQHPIETITGIKGYGLDEKEIPGIKRQGDMKVYTYTATESGAYYTTVSYKAQWSKSGDSGGPLLVNNGIIGVLSGGFRFDITALVTKEFTSLAHPKNRAFTTIGRMEDGTYGEAAKFCREKPHIKLLLGAPWNTKKENQSVKSLPPVDWKRGVIKVDIVDPMLEYNRYNATCDGQNCPVVMAVQDTILQASAKKGYQFVGWKSLDPAEPELCPCAAKADCKFSSVGVPWTVESRGFQCYAEFKLIQNVEPCDTPDSTCATL